MDNRRRPTGVGGLEPRDDLVAIDAPDPELELVGAAVRRALVRPLDPSVTDAHVRLMVAANRSAAAARRPARIGRRLGARRRDWWPAGAAVAAAALIAAVVVGGLPEPVQSRLADAAASVGITLPDGHDHTGRVSTLPPAPLPTPPPAVPSTAVAPTPRPAPTPTSAAALEPPPPGPSTTVRHPPTTPAPAASTPPVASGPTPTAPAPPAAIPTTVPTPTTASQACVDPVLVSMSATLINGGMAVAVVIHTTGTVPYMSANIAGMTGLVVDLHPTADGFAGTITASTPIPPGALVEIGSCAHRIRGSAVIAG